MLGLMQDAPLTITSIFDRCQRYFGTREIVTRTVTGIEHATVADMGREARRIAGYLDGLDDLAGEPDARIGTFGWNTLRHLALYFAVPASGRVLHTINIRYFPDQLRYTIEHAEDRVVFVDRSLLPVLAEHLPHLHTVRHVVVMDDGADHPLPEDPRVVRYADVVDAAPEAAFEGRVTDENQAAAVCYTTGTTGNPKGVLYSHRSSWLHASMMCLASTFGITDSDRVLPVVPMFHASAWGLPYASMMSGAAMVLPGPDLSPKALAELLETERVTVGGGVPTVWMGVLPELAGRQVALRAVLCGGSAVPRSLSEAYREAIGVPMKQAWGMTECSPVATVGSVRAEYAEASEDELADVRALQGLAVPGVEVRIVDSDTREPQAWDDASSGEVELRGPWCARQYFRAEEPGEQFSPDGWLRTGDVAAISPDGYVRLVDRTKDLVKSGGEWISSVDLENHIMGHPKVAEAAVIAVPHPKWAERPLACVVLKPGAAADEQADRAELFEFLTGRLTKWQLPDDIVFLDEVPKTSVGKFSKKTLRERFADHVLPTA